MDELKHNAAEGMDRRATSDDGLAQGFAPGPSAAAGTSIDDPRAVVARAVLEVAALARQRGLEVWTDTISPVATHARLDETTVSALLAELLPHCLRVTMHGSVGALIRGRGASQVVVEVMHTGAGIDASDFERLSYEAGHPLARARRLARQLGSDLVYERSHRGSGIYRFRFPIQTLAPIGATGPHAFEPCPDPPLAGRVLLVERDGENRRLLRRQFEDLGASVSVAESALGAIDRALFEDFHLVLLGVSRSGLRSLGTARVLRRAGLERPILALCDEADARQRQRIDDAGFDGVLLRPIDRLTVIELGARHLPRRRAQNSV